MCVQQFNLGNKNYFRIKYATILYKRLPLFSRLGNELKVERSLNMIVKIGNNV